MARPAAITKAEAIQKLSPPVENWIALAIPIINIKLENFTKGEHRDVDENEVYLSALRKDLRKRAIAEISAYYRAAGWKVSHDINRNPLNGFDDGSGWFTFS